MNNRVVALSAALCALLVSGVAVAQKLPGTGATAASSGAAHSSPEGTPTVTVTIPITASTFEACAFPTINPLNTTQVINLGPNAVITGLGGTGTIRTFGESFLSEASIMFRGAVVAEVIRLRPLSASAFTGTAGAPYNVAPIDLSSNALPNITLGASGNLTLEFCESFDDIPGSATQPDAQFVAPSNVIVQCFNCFDPFAVSALPAPAMSTWSLITLLLGLGLAGGLAVRRFS